MRRSRRPRPKTRRGFPPFVAAALARGAVGVIPTDTIYGVVARALAPRAVARVYKLRRRNPKKPFIILIHSASALAAFGVALDTSRRASRHGYRRAFLAEAWPGPVSVILPLAPRAAKKYAYLHRGTRALAFRVPADAALCTLLKKTGPLVAPSANPEGEPPAKSIKEAEKYFGAGADFYVDAGRITGGASSLIDLTGREPIVLRR